MNISDYLRPGSELVCETEYPEGSGWRLTVRYLPPDEMRRLTAEAAAQGLTLKGGRVVPRDDKDALAVSVARQITGWRGLTPEVAAGLVAELDVGRLKADGVTEIPCTDEIKLLMVRKAQGLLQHIDRAATAVENYRADNLEQEIKN